VRYTELDWVHRRARVEIGLHSVDGLADLLATVVAHGFLTLNLSRLYGRVTPVLDPPTGLLADAGFRREAPLPENTWLDGRPVDREIWGAVRDD
jgi:RimJ/RimL family protein N-acetyltransferase